MPKTASQSAFKKKSRNSVKYNESEGEGASIFDSSNEKEANLVSENDYLEYNSTE